MSLTKFLGVSTSICNGKISKNVCLFLSTPLTTSQDQAKIMVCSWKTMVNFKNAINNTNQEVLERSKTECNLKKNEVL